MATEKISQAVMSSPQILSLGQALWHQRRRIAALREKITRLHQTVNSPKELSLYQWGQFTAFALEFQPDLIIELGRLVGNSTCCFLEVANQLGGRETCKVISLCLSDTWFKSTVPRLRAIVPDEWFAAGDIRLGDILECDLSRELQDANRVLIFWDAHGFEVAGWVLGILLPLVFHKPHVVIMHDLSDVRFVQVPPDYGSLGLWKGEIADQPGFWLGHIFSRVPQAISIVDFSSRNHLPLRSADESLHIELINNPEKRAALEELLGNEIFSPQAHWFWFSLNEVNGEPYFPKFVGRLPTVVTEQPSPKAGETNFEKEYWEMQNSAGWRVLNRWRSWRNRLAPKGTLRRRAYDFLVRRFPGSA